MKHFVFTILMSFTISAFAQAPDFTGIDLNGESHSLYEDYLDQGKFVIVDFSATWCAPCWILHTSGVLEDAFETFGPDAGDVLMVLYVETDGNTNMNDLLGNTAPSQGNWIEGTEYPMIAANGNFIAGSYGITGLPSVRMICPNGTVISLDAQGINNVVILEEMMACTEPSNLSNDARIFYYNGLSTGCTDVDASIMVHNNGVNPIESLTIDVTREDGQTVTTTWNGNIASNGFETVVLQDVSLIGTQEATNFTVSIVSNDDNNSNNNKDITIQAVDAVLNDITVYVEADQWSSLGNAKYEILDENGTAVIEKGNIVPNQIHEATYSLPGDGCYMFQYLHEFGYGNNGAIRVFDANGTYAVNSGGFVGTSLVAPLRSDSEATGTTINYIPQEVNGIRIVRNDQQESLLYLELLTQGNVAVSVLTIEGKVMTKILDETLSDGEHSIQIETNHLSSGKYLILAELESGSMIIPFVHY